MQQFNIDPNFSVYALTKRSMQDTTMMNHRKTMSIISSEIENATLQDDAETVIFSAFQRMSKFLPQLARYRDIASKSKHVYVFGIVDCALPKIDNLTYVPLQEDDQLAKEWFLVSFGYNYFSALATEELSDIDDPDNERQFKGVWSLDVFMVGILYEWLSGIVGLRLSERESEDHDYTNHARIIHNTIERMRERVNKNSQNDPKIYNEVEQILRHNLVPAYYHMKSDPRVETLQTGYRATGTA